MSASRVTIAVGRAPVVDAHELPLEGTDASSALLARAYQRGFEAGAASAAQDRREEAAELLNAAADQLVARSEELTKSAAHTALELGLVVARELVLREVSNGEHDVEGIVRAALGTGGQGRGPCVVHLNPADAASLASTEFRAGTRIESDPGVRRGDVHVETSMGLIVRELDECLREVGERLREELR